MHMQPMTDEIREALVASRIEVEAGLEVLDEYGGVLYDISEYLDPDASSVARDAKAEIHGTCTLSLSTRLDWGRVRVRPYMLVNGHRVNLGAYVLSTPEATSGEDPETWVVEGYDYLEVLSHPYGKTYQRNAGTNVLGAVVDLLNELGMAFYVFGSIMDSPLLANDFTRPIDSKHTTLSIINELLALAGYTRLWVDWNGKFRTVSLAHVHEHGYSWTYDTADARTTVAPGSTLTEDYYDVPNVLVCIWDDPENGIPAFNAGLHVERVESGSRTSIEARGREITDVVKLEAATHEILVAQCREVMAERQRFNREWSASTAPNPFHWHRDAVRIIDRDLELDLRMMSRSWRLPLNGDDMSHTFEPME